MLADIKGRHSHYIKQENDMQSQGKGQICAYRVLGDDLHSTNWYPLEWNQEQRECLYRWPIETARMWEERIRPLVNYDIGGYFQRMGRGLPRDPFSPSIFVFFPDDIPVSGHCAKVRKVWCNMPIQNYSLTRQKASHPGAKGYRKMGAGFIHSKHVLRKMAEESPVFRPIWEDLKEISPDDCGIYLAEMPDPDLLASLQDKEEALWAEYRDAKNLDKLGLDLRRPEAWEAEILAQATWERIIGNSVAACGLLRPMLESDSMYWGFWEPLVENLLDSEDPEGAYEVVHKGQSRYPDCLLFDRLGFRCCMDLKLYIQAERHAKRLMDLNPWGPLEMLQYADVSSKMGNNALAARLHQECAEHRGLSQSRQVELGVVLARSGQVPEAISVFRRLIEEGDPHPLALNNIGMLLAGAGQLDDALDFSRQALAKEESISCLWDTMGFIQMKLGDQAEAERALLKAVSLNPMDPDAWRHLLHVYHRSGQAEKLAKTSARVGYYLPEELKRFERERDNDIME